MLKNRQEPRVTMNQGGRAPDHTREVVGPCCPGLKALTTTRRKTPLTLPLKNKLQTQNPGQKPQLVATHQTYIAGTHRGVHLPGMPKTGEKVHHNGGVKHTLLGINAGESSSLECMSPNTYITKDPTMLD